MMMLNRWLMLGAVMTIPLACDSGTAVISPNGTHVRVTLNKTRFIVGDTLKATIKNVSSVSLEIPGGWVCPYEVRAQDSVGTLMLHQDCSMTLQIMNLGPNETTGIQFPIPGTWVGNSYRLIITEPAPANTQAAVRDTVSFTIENGLI